MMRHLSDGLLRRMVDEPLTISASDRQHYKECASCRSRYGDISADAREAGRVLSTRDLDIDTSRALARLQDRIVADHVALPPRWRARLSERLAMGKVSRPLSGFAVAAGLVGALTLTPAGSLAQQFVTVFQPEQVQAVPVTGSDVKSLRSLARFGTVRVPAGNVPDTLVQNAAEASSRSGMTVLVPSQLPGDIPTNVQYHVVSGQSASFTFSAAKARRYAQTHKKTLPAMTQNIDGSTLQVVTGTSVVALWGTSGSRDLPSLVIGQMKAPRVYSTAASVKEIENYVLRLPGISQPLAAAIRSIGDPTTTLPLPIPVNLAHATRVTVQGVPGYAIGDATGVGSVVVWEKGGIVYGVGGALPQSETMSIAESLK